MFNGDYLLVAADKTRGLSSRSIRVSTAENSRSRKARHTCLPLDNRGRAKGPKLDQPSKRTAPAPTIQSADAERDHKQFGISREADSILSIYMRDAGEVPLLSLLEEAELAARIKRGDDFAREHMIRSNLRFVIKIARQYENLGMPLLDLINEGNIGLIKAVERFDPAKGGKLSTYAALWIKQQIRRALASQGKTIRLPIHVADKIYHLTQAEVRLRHQLGREATDEELAEELGIKVSRLARLRRAAMRPASLDTPLGEDGSATIADVVADDNARTPFEAMRDGTETKLVSRLVDQLSEREANIIRFRFGLDGGTERTLEEVGKKFKLTRERIRQLQNLALEKLRKMLEDPKLFPVAA